MILISSPRLKSRLVKLFWITSFWILVAFLQFFNGYATIVGFELDTGELNVYGFLLGSLVTGLTAGLLGGGMMVFYWERWLRTLSYSKSLWYIFLSYTFIYFVVAVITQIYVHTNQLGVAYNHPSVGDKLMSALVSLNLISSYLFWLLVVIITLIALLVNDKYGPGVFADFLLGKYFHPRREERVFMFLDLRSSTGIAEKLGEERYFQFLKEVYSDITPAILKNKGEIYQYVGDEVVISWKTSSIKSKPRVIDCFLDIQQILGQRAGYYAQKYDQVEPEFKAGLHYGFVMAGEIGIVKRDIAYSGDVLNTTARIQSKCNELGVDILLSKYLVERLRKLDKDLIPTAMGEIPLRGKQESLELYTI